jgi:hypothetical protein
VEDFGGNNFIALRQEKKMKITAAILLVVSVSFAHAQESGAYIREITGTVEIKPPGAAQWKAAEPGEIITRDTVISTGFKSTALIALGNSILTVRPLTRLSVEAIQNRRGNESVDLFIQTGRIRAEVKPPAGGSTGFTVRTPTATASVRGTVFDFDGFNLRVTEGQVHLTGGDGTAVYVGAGHQAAADPVTGRTAGAEETAKAELIPALPAAAAEDINAPAAFAPAAADRTVSFEWQD